MRPGALGEMTGKMAGEIAGEMTGEMTAKYTVYFLWNSTLNLIKLNPKLIKADPNPIITYSNLIKTGTKHILN